MRKFKLLVKDSGGPSIAILKYFDKNIERINAMGVTIVITKIDEDDLDKDMVTDLAENGIARLPALITDNDKKFVGNKIKDVFDKNLQAYKRRDTASAPARSGSKNMEFGTNPDLGAYYHKHLMEDKSDEIDDANEIKKDIERKRREYQAPKHRIDPSKERDDIGERSRRGAPRRPQPAADDAPRPAASRKDTNVDPDDNIEIGNIGNSVLESLEHTEHEEASNADDVMERAYWENKSSGFAPDG